MASHVLSALINIRSYAASGLQKARETAMHPIQVRVIAVKGPPKTLGECHVPADVIRIFRDATGKLVEGTPVEFKFSCNKDRRYTSPVGGTLWTDYHQLTQAKYVKVFLNSHETWYKVAL